MFYPVHYIATATSALTTSTQVGRSNNIPELSKVGNELSTNIDSTRLQQDGHGAESGMKIEGIFGR